MPAIERVIPLVNYLPTSIRDALARRLRELVGLGLIAAASIAAAALMTWSVRDPSLSHATSRAIRNIVGYPGAIGADLLMQILGLGAIMVILPIAVRGWRMLTHRPFDREALRVGAWTLCVVISAGFASCWPRSAAWPLPAAYRAFASSGPQARSSGSARRQEPDLGSRRASLAPQMDDEDEVAE